MAIKLKNLPNKEKSVALTLSLKESEDAELERYLAFVCNKTGGELTKRELLAAMVLQFLEDDRDFQASKKKKPAAKASSMGHPAPTHSNF